MHAEILRRDGRCDWAQLCRLGPARLVLFSAWRAGERDCTLPEDRSEIACCVSADGGRSWSGARTLAAGVVDTERALVRSDGKTLALLYLQPHHDGGEIEMVSLQRLLVREDGQALGEAVTVGRFYRYANGPVAALDRGRLSVAWEYGRRLSLARAPMDGVDFETIACRTTVPADHMSGLHADGDALTAVLGRGDRDSADLCVSLSKDGRAFGKVVELAHDNSDWAFRVPHRSCACGRAAVVLWSLKGRDGFNVYLARCSARDRAVETRVLCRQRRLRGALGAVASSEPVGCYAAIASIDEPCGLEAFRIEDEGRISTALPAPDFQTELMAGSLWVDAHADRFYALSQRGKALYCFAWIAGVPQPPRRVEFRGRLPDQEVRCVCASDEDLLVLSAAADGPQCALHLACARTTV
ncbi:MAG: hypothetical protein JXR96_25555 [Deltaproteobacteria bacterium]|nr:hypothetical protein [Deltaproteobacteria bacterium]